jgi:acyl carrier protein
VSSAEATILSEIARVVARELEMARPVQPDDRLIEDQGLDSMTLTTLAVALEDRFQVLLTDEAATGTRTVGELARLVAERMTGDAAVAP